MNRKYYVKDKNGTVLSTDGKTKFRLVFGEELNRIFQEEKRFFYLFKNSFGDVIGVECTEEQYKKYEVDRKHRAYLKKQKDINNILEVSGNEIVQIPSEDDVEMIENISDESVDCEKEIERKQMIEALRKVLETLKPEEYEMIYNLYLAEEPKSERQYAEEKGIHHMTVHNRKVALLKKIKKFL